MGRNHVAALARMERADRDTGGAVTVARNALKHHRSRTGRHQGVMPELRRVARMCRLALDVDVELR